MSNFETKCLHTDHTEENKKGFNHEYIVLFSIF